MVGGVAVGDYFELSLVGLIAPGCHLGFLTSEMPDFVGSAGFGSYNYTGSSLTGRKHVLI
jgi:hypothetical protein